MNAHVQSTMGFGLLGVALLCGCYSGLDAGEVAETATTGQDSREPGGADADDSGAGESGGVETCAGACAGPTAMHLIRRRQVIGIVRQAFGDAANAVPFELVPADPQNGLFAFNHLPADGSRVAHYNTFAEEAASVLVDELACSDETCVEAHVREALPVLYKRAPTEDEIETALGMLAPPSAYEGEWTLEDGFRQVLTFALQAPQLLYRIEIGVETDDPSVRRLTGHELVTRLTLALWSQSPPEALRTRAAAGELDDQEEVSALVREMLEDLRADAVIAEFFSGYLGTDHFGEHTRYQEGAAEDPTLPTLVDDMRRETETFVSHIMRNGGSMRELFTADYTFASDALAAHYGFPLGEPYAEGLYRVPIAEPRRAGVLSHGSVVGSHTTVEAYRAAHRGKFIAENVLCMELPPPPGDIDVPEIPVGLPPREAFTKMTDSETCAGCHDILNPLGFVFENLDGAGNYLDVYPGFGTPVDASGSLPSGEEVDGVAELGATLAQSEVAQRCLTRRWFEFALERQPGDLDEIYLDAAHARLVETDLDVREVVVTLLSSEAARLRVLPADE